MTKSQLQQIIKEELEKVLSEQDPTSSALPGEGEEPQVPDPRDVKKLICDNKKVVIAAINAGRLGTLTMFAPEHMQALIKILLDVVRVARPEVKSIDDLLKDPTLQAMAIGGIIALCALSDLLPGF